MFTAFALLSAQLTPAGPIMTELCKILRICA
jgi:hypothetical protein